MSSVINRRRVGVGAEWVTATDSDLPQVPYVIPKQAPRMREAPPQPLTQTPQTATAQVAPGAVPETTRVQVFYLSPGPEQDGRITWTKIQVVDQQATRDKINLAVLSAVKADGGGELTVTFATRARTDSVKISVDDYWKIFDILRGVPPVDPGVTQVRPQFWPGTAVLITFGEPPYAASIPVPATPGIDAEEWQRLRAEDPDSAEAIVQCIVKGECPLNQMQMFAVALAEKGYPNLAKAMEMRIQQAGGS